MEYFAPYPANVITSDQTGQFASVTALVNSGALLYSWIVVASGAGGGISSSELAATGAKITSLSGYVNNISGYLDNRFSLTGSNLDSKINSLSGFGTSTFATIINLGTTGSNLCNLVIGLSGDDASRYATLINLTSTGANLQGQINSINTAGYITTGLADLRFVHLNGNETISGIKTFRGPINIETFAGDGLVVNINGISGTYAGTTGAGNEINIFQGQLKIVPNIVTIDWFNRILSGEWTTNTIGTNPQSLVAFQELSNVSGAIVSQISASSAGVSQLNSKSGIVTLIGTGGITITTAGQQIIISGAASGSAGALNIGTTNGLYLLKVANIPEQDVLSPVLFADIARFIGARFPSGANGIFTYTDPSIGDYQLNVDSRSLGFELDGTGGDAFTNGLDFARGIIYLTDFNTGTKIDFNNQTLSGEWTFDSQGNDPFKLINFVRLSGASGALQDQIAGFATIGNLTQTGIVLLGKINSLSGFVGGISGALQTLIINNAVNISGNLALTGSNVYNLITGGSGQANTNFATIVNLTQTGVILGAKIDSLSGYVGNVSGALQTLLVNNSTNISGNLTLTGIALGAKIDSVSGYTANLSGALQTLLVNNSINLSGNLTATGILLSAVKVTGSSIINNVNFAGLGGTLVFSSGGFIFISGAAAGGGGAVTSVNGLAGAVLISGTGTVATNVLNGQTYISGGGTKTIRTWNALENEPPASNYAVFNSRNSHPLLSFDEIVQQASVFRGRVPESTNFLNGFTISTQWLAEASVTGTLVSGIIGWDAAIERIVSGGQSLDVDGFGTAKTIVALSGYQNGITRTTSVNFTTGDMPVGFGAGDMFRLRIRRDVANDNSTGNAQLLQVDMTLQ